MLWGLELWTIWSTYWKVLMATDQARCKRRTRYWPGLRQCLDNAFLRWAVNMVILDQWLTSFSVLTVIPLTVCLSWNIKVFRKSSQFGRASAFFLVIFGKLLRARFKVPEPAKLKFVRVRSVRNDVSVPFASCPSNRRHSEYYSCQTGSYL